MEQQYTEDDMRNACAEYAKTNKLRATARNWAIPPSTLRIRLNGALPRSVAHQDYQRLSVAQEKHLADWIRVQQAVGVPPTHAQIREMASRVCMERGDDQPLGIKWMEGFLKRHPFLKTQRAKVVDVDRINCATEATIRPWFNLFHIPEVKAILPENRWNKDEAGIMEGRGENGLVVGTADHKALQKKQPGGRT
jgi:4-hydroxybenzoate polyprenyltransferase